MSLLDCLLNIVGLPLGGGDALLALVSHFELDVADPINLLQDVDELSLLVVVKTAFAMARLVFLHLLIQSDALAPLFFRL